MLGAKLSRYSALCLTPSSLGFRYDRLYAMAKYLTLDRDYAVRYMETLGKIAGSKKQSMLDARHAAAAAAPPTFCVFRTPCNTKLNTRF